nr:excinuclease ABC subunit UvrA [Oceanococcus sp. HetDA_MAG_MS8]
MKTISVRGARTHNLRDLSVDIPRDKLVVITGLSGSGKSSLAFDTIYAEGQRRYVESLSAYARQFLSMMDKPDVDSIEGLSPAISIEQKSTSHNPRSTVGTVTEIQDYLRLLFARVGVPYCPDHHISLTAKTVSQMVDSVLQLPEDSAWMLLAPIIRGRKGEHRQLLEQLRAEGFIRIRVDGELHELDELPSLNPKTQHDVDVVIDRFKVRSDQAQRLAESFETALRLADGLAIVAPWRASGDAQEHTFSARFACPECGFTLQELEPRLFSFNSPHGACSSCDGLGTTSVFDADRIVANPKAALADGAIRGWDRRNPYYYALLTGLSEHYDIDLEMPFQDLPPKHREVVLYGSGRTKIRFEYPDLRGRRKVRNHTFEGIVPNLERRYRETESDAVREELARYRSNQPCSACDGSRLNRAASAVQVASSTLPQISRMSIADALAHFEKMELPGQQAEIARPVLKEIGLRLSFLNNVGLDYLSLDRAAETLSGGESQRIRLASQIGAGLVGVLYVLDEPSIGLHQRDNQRLIDTLVRLRDLGNTVLVVEHDEDAIRCADHVLDIGPRAGVHGGEVVAAGTPEEVIQTPASLTGQYLSGERRISIPEPRQAPDAQRVLRIEGASGNNLQQVDVELPLGCLICITGVSGSGKSTLINDTLYPIAARELNRASLPNAPVDKVRGLDQLDKVIGIDQSPIGRTPRSNPATYIGLFTGIRELFAGVPEARARGYTPGRFSFNVKGGRCEACQGDGLIKVEMHFLPDVYVLCEVCQGHRYNRETLDIRYKGKTIAEVLEMTVEDAVEFFGPVPALKRKLVTLMDVGLSYITLGQSATTLSGGEAQRVKLAKELSRRDTGKTLYILDEPTTGLHFHDVEQLLQVLHRLRDHGNTVVVIEHNLDVIKTADWLVDLGPEGGAGGGQIVATGTPEEVAANPNSHTGHYLKPILERGY